MIEKFVGWVSQIAASIEAPAFFPHPATSSNSHSSLIQTFSTSISSKALPTLRQCINTHHFDSAKPSSFLNSNSRHVPDSIPDTLNKPINSIIFVFIFNSCVLGTTLDVVKRRRNGLLVEAVDVVTEEAAVEKDGGGEGREAAGELGAGGSEAEEAVSMREIKVALSQCVDRNVWRFV